MDTSKPVEIRKISSRFPDVQLASNVSTIAYMAVPAITTVGECEKLQVVIYTNKGTVIAPLLVGKYKWNTGKTACEAAGSSGTPVLTVALVQKGLDSSAGAANQGYKKLASGSFASMKANAWSSISISFTEDAIVVPTAMNISTIAGGLFKNSGTVTNNYGIVC